MIINEKSGLKYITFESFENTGAVNHCVSTRMGGVSQGIYSSLNLSFSRGDSKENVMRNFEIICKVNNMDYKNIVMSSQTHKTNIRHVNELDRGKGILYKSDIEDTDGLITNVPNVVLVTFFADCVPLLFLDPVKKVIALSHAGWRGTVDGIGRKTIEEMASVYGSKPKDILTAIGPSIGKCCFQVDKPVVMEFNEKLEFSSKYIIPDTNFESKYKIDLWGINYEIMKKAGILPKNISVSGLCTMCNSELLFSHRVMGNERGSLAALMELKA